MKYKVILNLTALLVILTTKNDELTKNDEVKLETDDYGAAMDKFNTLQLENPDCKPKVDMDDSTDWDEKMTPERQEAQDNIIADAKEKLGIKDEKKTEDDIAEKVDK